MDTALPQKFPFVLDRNLAKANCTENRACTSWDTEVLDFTVYIVYLPPVYKYLLRVPYYIPKKICLYLANECNIYIHLLYGR